MLVLFVTAVLMTSIAAVTIPAASALTSRSNFNDNHYTALFPGGPRICGDHICAPGEYDQMQQALAQAQMKGKTAPSTTPSAPSAPSTPSTPSTTPSAPSASQGQNMPTMAAPTWTTKTGTVTSIQDPGQGHETHQLAIILPPSDKIYTGTISFTASEPIQIVELTGPLASGDDKGQPVWTTDGKTKFALTLVDVNQASGSFAFTGNALAIHQMTNKTFTVSYAVSYTESSPSDTVKTGTLTSVQDPGQGHEGHQLALVLPPSSNPYHGVLTYSASENVQLVSLIGPIDPTDNKGQPVYTMEGKTWYALVFVDTGNQMGTWQFAGNAIAVHTLHTTPFQVSYTVSAHQ